MVADNIFSVRHKAPSDGQTKLSNDSLISPERAQKLDLLSHLLTNLKQSLIVSGPLGIGKTTLLQHLGERLLSGGSCYYYIVGSPQLSFESLEAQLNRLIKEEQTGSTLLDLSHYLVQLDQARQKWIVIIDDAGLLVPGLIDAINRYAKAHPALRVVFALTQDEVYVKNSSDQTLEECHFIDLPPLSEKQCGEFLRNLSGKPGAAIAFAAIDETLIARVYQETHGIPGRIMAMLPQLSEYGTVKTIKWLPWALLILSALAAFFYWSLQEIGPITEKPLASNRSAVNWVALAPPKHQQIDKTPILPVSPTDPEKEKQAVTTIAPLAKIPGAAENPEADIADKPVKVPEVGVGSPATLEPAPEKPGLPEAKQAPDAAAPVPTKTVKVEPATSPEVMRPALKPQPEPQSESPVEQTPRQANTATDDRPWVLAQPPQNYTLQLIVLSSGKSLIQLMNKYPALQQQFKAIKTISKGKEKHSLLYGSFVSAQAAGNAMQSLPKAFQKSWVRRFKTVQNDIKNSR
ncbi:MAG: hypothetical protein CVV13_07635 [Gammaproteobacteria bacterium HGW-Gammaproteobacteria-3]|nr:MAG: hypothetical protein CVV13_07635 [Gammaproteobacteria bacterium HGW-Gammaproteobacteria-3]